MTEPEKYICSYCGEEYPLSCQAEFKWSVDYQKKNEFRADELVMCLSCCRRVESILSNVLTGMRRKP